MECSLSLIRVRRTRRCKIEARFYGYADKDAALAALKSAKVLSQRLSLTYQELTDMVTTGFLNPALYPLIFQFRRFGISMSDAFSFTVQPGYPALSVQAKAVFQAQLDAIQQKYKDQNPTSTFDATAWLNNVLPANYSGEGPHPRRSQ